MDQIGMLQELMRCRCLLEIGMNLGRSAAIWLEAGVEYLFSVDVNRSPVVASAGNTLKLQYEERFDFALCESSERMMMIQRFNPPKFDAIFIDGDHEYRSVMDDIELARAFGIWRMALDDCHPHWGPGVQQAVADSGVKIHAMFGTIAYCEDINRENWVTNE